MVVICSSVCCNCRPVSALMLWVLAAVCCAIIWQDKSNLASPFDLLSTSLWLSAATKMEEKSISDNEQQLEKKSSEIWMAGCSFYPPGGCHNAEKMFSNQCLTEQWLGSLIRITHRLHWRGVTMKTGQFRCETKHPFSNIMICGLWGKMKNVKLCLELLGKCDFFFYGGANKYTSYS